LLWLRGGGDLAEITSRSVAVVGACACTPYGGRQSAELGSTISERGWGVVSGGAFGIDAAAHRGALAADRPTVAVLACGADRIYPAGHDGLFERVRHDGVLVTELSPGCYPGKLRFLARNRVIAALTTGTVVVEAAWRSGALNTANHAADLGRVVMAIPGPVTSAMSAGCHELVRTKGASLVTDAADVIDLVGPLGVDDVPARRGEVRPLDSLDPELIQVLDALPVRRGVDAGGAAQISGLDLPTTVRTLSLLAARGLVEGSGGLWRKRPARRAGA
jgi:DNA processing protein